LENSQTESKKRKSATQPVLLLKHSRGKNLPETSGFDDLETLFKPSLRVTVTLKDFGQRPIG